MSFLFDIAKGILEDTTREVKSGRIVKNAGTAVVAGLAGAAIMKSMTKSNPSPVAYPQEYPQGPQNMSQSLPSMPVSAVGPTAPAAPIFSFYAIIEGVKRGPYNEVQFKRLIENDLANANTMVWKDGMTEWIPAGQVKMMEHLFTKQPPQQPQTQQPAQQVAPVMPQVPQQNAYYVNFNNQMVGPFNTQQLQHFAQTGEFNQQMYVWCEGMPEWKTAGNVEELAAFFGPAVPQMPTE
ncbi:MAG: DUF4339 domain-containing protein [Muribaculaceae bacterium]|nr:DUF4339 domain-containing protein [Muribaculaceae bacterium]